MRPFLEAQAALAGAFGEGLDPAVVAVPAAVEHGLADALGQQALRDVLSHGLGRRDLGARELLAQLGVEGRAGRERDARAVVDGLGVDLLAGAVHGEARPLGGAAHARAHRGGLAGAADVAEMGGSFHGSAQVVASDLPTLRLTYSPS